MLMLRLRFLRWQSTGFTRVTTPYSDKAYQPIISLGIAGLERLDIPKDFHAGNQEVVIDREQQRHLEGIVESFEAPILTSIGYGSGVLPQAGYNPEAQQQIDLIHVVDDSGAFHKRNTQQSPQHYSTTRVALLNLIQGSEGIYFNPYCNINHSVVKYGVVSRHGALRDLTEWSQMYFAGRLQKPVNYVRDNDAMVKFLNQFNLKNAMTLSVIILGGARSSHRPQVQESFTERQLYEQITRLSYLGDFRMYVGGENPNKVKNIVEKQYALFKQVYEPIIDYFILKDYLVIVEHGPNKVFRPNLTVNNRIQLISTMPLGFRKRLYGMYMDKSIKEIAKDPQLADQLTSLVSRTIWSSSIKQAVRGIFSAGLLSSAKYAWAKNSKYRS
ncbi:phosphatidate cytidylyltransferase, mitochondrial [Diutina catenulata]